MKAASRAEEERQPGGAGRGRKPVAVVTGSRSEFGLLAGTIERLLSSAEVEPRVIVAGMHLDPALGSTEREVEASFPVAARVAMSPPEDSPGGMGLAVAEGIRGFLSVFAALGPRLVLVLGDRIEPLAAALAAAYRDLPVAHIHGGDLSGNALDDLHRDLISRAARLHLVATEKSAARLRAMAVEGEVLVVGAPGLDAALSLTARPREELLRRLGMPAGRRLLVVVHHPLPRLATVGGEGAAAEVEEVLAAALEFGRARGSSVALLYPNNDAGHRAVIERIERRRGEPGVSIFPTLPRRDFLDLLRSAEALLGNSSAGIIESVSLGVPVVNVGARQSGRERNPNVVDAPAERGAILKALERALADPEVRSAVLSRRNLYGDGRAAERIARAVESFLGRA
jgi:GDP/UDP-N,N'-diacetylbacillosamine 2-epimerase (hydrolysing)